VGRDACGGLLVITHALPDGMQLQGQIEPVVAAEKRRAFARAVMDGFWPSMTAI